MASPISCAVAASPATLAATPRQISLLVSRFPQHLHAAGNDGRPPACEPDANARELPVLSLGSGLGYQHRHDGRPFGQIIRMTVPLLTCEAVLAETSFHLQDTARVLRQCVKGPSASAGRLAAGVYDLTRAVGERGSRSAVDVLAFLGL